VLYFLFSQTYLRDEMVAHLYPPPTPEARRQEVGACRLSIGSFGRLP
jgi:hypothetical protein